MELWKEVPPLESAIGNIDGWLVWKADWLFHGLVDSYLKDLGRQTEKPSSLVGSFGPLVDARIYNDIQELSIIAKRYYLIARSQKQKEPLETDSSASSVKFAEVRARLFKSINDRIKEISQYDHPAEPADK
jgi:hypothetical protein